MTNEQREKYYSLLQKKAKETNWNNLQSIKDYNNYATELRKMFEENWK